MAKRQPSEVICSFCLNTILRKDAYTVVLKMHPGEPEDKSEYYTACCDKKGCLNSERIIRIKEEPKN